MERGICKREENDILELDIVTNKFSKGKEVEKSLCEIKSGGWGFPDIFKVRGWMDYLSFNNSSFIVQKEENRNMIFCKDVSKSIDVTLLSTKNVEGKLMDEELCSVYNITKNKYHDEIVECFRFSYALEHKLIEMLTQTIKSNTGIEGYENLNEYLFEINNNSFFIPKPIDRAKDIISAFKNNKNITAKIDHERNGEKYAEIEDKVSITQKKFKELFYVCKKTDVLYTSLYAELVSKLDILKCCVEDMQRPKEKSVFKMKELSEIDLLPLNIVYGMEKLKTHTYFYLYPYFWQVFIYLFGGFILKDKEKIEYEVLSSITDIPTDEIPNALIAFDLLFPIQRSKWIFDIRYSKIKMLRFMPIPFCGIGANFRRLIYTEASDYKKLKSQLSGLYTFDNLIKWNNLLMSYLEGCKGLEVSASKE